MMTLMDHDDDVDVDDDKVYDCYDDHVIHPCDQTNNTKCDRAIVCKRCEGQV